MKNCLFCNKEIVKKPKQSNYAFDRIKYCNYECAYANRVGEKSPRWIGAKKDVQCKKCGKVMSLYACQPRIYCSHKCRAADPEWRVKHSEAVKGNVAWNKGDKGVKPWMNMSGLYSVSGISWNKGKKGLQTAWNKGIKNPALSGENNPNWKGGITQENNKIRSSMEYKQWRMAVFQRDHFTCQHCFKKGGITLHADHIKQFAYYPELRLDVNNGRTLCVDCHRKTDTYSAKKKQKAA